MNQYNALALGPLMQARNDTMHALSKAETIEEEADLKVELDMINELIRSARNVV
jgi:hypothetical protein